MDLSTTIDSAAGAFGNAASDAASSYATMWANYAANDLTARLRPPAASAGPDPSRPGLTVTRPPPEASSDPLYNLTNPQKLTAIFTSWKTWAAIGAVSVLVYLSRRR